MARHRLPPFMRARHQITRRHFIGASGLLASAGWLSSSKIPIFSRAYADEMMEHYKSAAIDWRQAEGQSIVLGGLEHPWMNAVQPLLPQFTELTGIEISAELQSESEYTAEIPIKLGGGSAVPDVYMVFSLGQAIEAGWLEPLDQHYGNVDLFDAAWYEEDDIFASARSFPVWHDGERYVMAITAEAQTLFINQPFLDAVGAAVPTTFDELYETAVALKNDTTAGIAMRAKAPDGGPWPAGGFIFSHGGEIVGADGVVKIDSPEAIAAIDMYGKLLRDAGPLGVGNYHWYECLNDFMTEAVAIGLDSSNFATDIANPEKSLVAGNAVYGAMPSSGDKPAKANMWHWQAGINSKSEHKEAAWLFLQWVTSKPTSAQTAAAGLATPRSSAWQSSGFREAFGEQAAEAALANLEGADGDVMKACWFHPKSGEILEPFGIGINEVVTGTKDAETAMKEAAEKANAAIQG
ncbi:MAG: ABC transporter substrate-binding protein [Geminicoccaceae bacterium]